jgi:hypothetical protein
MTSAGIPPLADSRARAPAREDWRYLCRVSLRCFEPAASSAATATLGSGAKAGAPVGTTAQTGVSVNNASSGAPAGAAGTAAATCRAASAEIGLPLIAEAPRLSS